MPKYNKTLYKQYIANHQIEQLIEKLLQELHQYISAHPQSNLQHTYNDLIILSGKWKSIQQEENLGIAEVQSTKIEKARISKAVLNIIDDLPNDYFDFLNGNKKTSSTTTPDLRQQIEKVHQSSAYEYDVFFSFSSQDLSEAKRICEELRGYGLHVFLSDEALKANTGLPFFEKIDYALKNSQHFILLSSIDAMASEWVKTEYQTFFNEYYIKQKRERRFIILKSKNYSAAAVPGLLKTLQFANSPKEILATFIKDKRFKDRQEEKKRQAAARALEQKALAEKRQKEQQALEQKALAEQRQRAENRLLQQQAAERQAKQKELQERALQEKRARERQQAQAAQAKQAAAEKRRKKAERQAAWTAFFEKNGKKIGLGLVVLIGLVIGGQVIPSMFSGGNGGENSTPFAEIDTLETPEIRPANPALEAEKTYNKLIQEANDFFDTKDYDKAKNKYNAALFTAKGFSFDKQNAEDRIAACDKAIKEIETKKAAEKKKQAEADKPKEKQEPKKTRTTSSLSPIIVALEKNMKRIPPGLFIMGCTSEQSDCHDDEKPTHQVSISSFKMNKYEVTQEEWRAVMESPWYSYIQFHFSNCDKCPVENVSWNDIQKFLKKLNQMTGKNYRLPSEAEWEYAARGNERYKYAGSNDIDEVAWYRSNSGNKTNIVGRKKANGFGLHDMSGNVREWCQDNWHNNYNGAPINGRTWIVDNKSDCVSRGGSWLTYAQSCRITHRNSINPDYRIKTLGFRLAHR